MANSTSRRRVVVIDDGEMYMDLVAEQMPELELVHPPNQSQPRLPDGPAALAFFAEHGDDVDLALLDVHFDVAEQRLLPLPEAATLRRRRRFQGIAIFRELRRQQPTLPIVLLTARADLALGDVADELAAESLTYFLDSDDLDTLRIRINSALAATVALVDESPILWGNDERMRALRRRLAVLARGRLPMILEGETGTGKSYLAEHYVHVNSGRSGPFVAVDLSTLPESLIPAQLFGAFRGAYTGAVSDRKGLFEAAHGGTLLIDEIHNAPLDVQKQLLLVLQEGRFRPLGATRDVVADVKVIAASNTSLAKEAAKGRFRPDLYMRLCPPTRVVLPPLREREADIHWLLHRFVEGAVRDGAVAELRDEVAEALKLPAVSQLRLRVGSRSSNKGRRDGIELVLPRAADNALAEHRWPGNVRELQMVAHNIVTFTLVAAVDALRSGTSLSSSRLQVDPGLVGGLLAGSSELGRTVDRDADQQQARAQGADTVRVVLGAADSLNAVSNDVERQYMLALYERARGDFGEMAGRLLGDPTKARAVRLRFNQLGMKVSELKGR